MYQKHFGLTRHPFTKDLSPDELFVARAGKELEVRLGHLLELRGIGLVTGEAGSGKTTLCRKVVSSLHSGLYRVFYVPLSTGNAMDMYKCIAWGLGLPTERSRAALYRVICAEVTRLCLAAKMRLILVIVEAQLSRLGPADRVWFGQTDRRSGPVGLSLFAHVEAGTLARPN